MTKKYYVMMRKEFSTKTLVLDGEHVVREFCEQRAEHLGTIEGLETKISALYDVIGNMLTKEQQMELAGRIWGWVPVEIKDAELVG